jgi:uncharacterized protein (DUF885 family)
MADESDIVHERLEALAERAVDSLAAAHPFGASMIGIRDYDAEVGDISEQGDNLVIERLEEISMEAESIDASELADEDRITREVLILHCRDGATEMKGRLRELQAGPIFGSAHAEVIELVPKVSLTTAEQARAYIERCSKLGRYLEQGAERLRTGLARGRGPVGRAVRSSIEQLDRYLATDVDDDVFLIEPPPDWEQSDEWRNDLRETITTVVRPAIAAYKASLSEIVSTSRPDDRCGLTWIEDGESIYRDLVATNTTTDLTPERLHEMGIEVISRLADEYQQLAGEVLGEPDVPSIFERLRSDPDLRFRKSRDVFDAAEAALRRAQAAVPDCFGRLPKTECIVREIPLIEAPTTTIAYYMPPAIDGSRPGTYWINTYKPETRPTYECEALAFHESVPGHHFQIALAQELDLPRFRRLADFTAFVEGWALYTERLADDMGLYSGDLQRLGMLSFDSWRACRLVVDTGIHAMGWSRDRAVEFMRDNSPLALNNIENEVDRYIAMPGQALAYMVGRLEIERLRAEAEAKLGAEFNVTGFHDALLEHGSVPLSTLSRLIEEWAEKLAS